ELIDSKVWHMTATSEKPTSGTLTMVMLKDLITGKTIAAFNTHLAFSNINMRDAESRFIAEQIEPYAKQMPVVLTGDLNTFSQRLDMPLLPAFDGDYVQRTLTKGSLKNSQDVSILGHLGPISTFTNAPEGKCLP